MTTSSTSARLAFFGMTEEPPPTATTKAGIDDIAPGVDPGPAPGHRLHGGIELRPGHELRVTSQPERTMPNGTRSPARLTIREWYRREGTWWTQSHRSGVQIRAADVEAFARVVAEAARSLAREADGGQ
jgi:hypothetical protein